MESEEVGQKELIRYQASEDYQNVQLSEREEAFVKNYVQRKYFVKWISYIEEARIQTVKKMKIFKRQDQQYQNNQSQKSKQQTPKTGSFIKNQQTEQLEIQQDEIKYGMAIKKHQKIIKIKVIQSLMKYNIKTKHFMNLIASSYCQFLNKKYFAIILQYKNKRFSERVVKIENMRKKITLIRWKNIHFQILRKINQKNEDKIKMCKTFNASLKEEQKIIAFSSRNHILQNNQKGNFTQKGFDKFQEKEEPRRNLALGLSRNSNVSSLSNQSDFLSKRKFKPILQAPSFPDLKAINEIQHQNKNESKNFSPIHKKLSLQSEQKSQEFSDTYEQPINRKLQLQKQIDKQLSNEAFQQQFQKSKQSQKDTQNKQSVLGLLTKLKLIQLKIMSESTQFKQSFQEEQKQKQLSGSSNKKRLQGQFDSSSYSRLFQAYMSNSKKTLVKLKQLKV